MSRTELRSTLRLFAERLLRRGGDWPELAIGGDRLLAFSPPGFLGVSESTRRFFTHWYPLEARDLVLRSDRRRFVEQLLAAAPAQVVFSGFDRGYGDVLERIRDRQPALRVHVLWHASPMQLDEACNREHFSTIVSLARRGVITRVGCFKTGLSRTFSRLGVEASDVYNLPPASPPHDVGAERDGCDAIGDRPLRLGLFLAGPSWRKNPYAMLDAAARLGRVELTGVLDPQACHFAESLGLDTAAVSASPLSREVLERAAKRQDCNLYVGLSECSPLFPLESLHWGIPCLIGPASHLFLRSPLASARGEGGSVSAEVREAATRLEELLVVSRPEDPDAIAAAIRRAIEARDEILIAYRCWVDAYRLSARSSMEALLGRSLPPPEAPA